MAQWCNTTKIKEERIFIKTINHKINGLGHYYKSGNVAGLYEKLDAYLRNCVYAWYKKTGRKKPTKKHLSMMGLRSLTAIYKMKKQVIIAPKVYKSTIDEYLTNQNPHKNDTLYYYLEKLTHQNAEMIGQLSKIAKLLES